MYFIVCLLVISGLLIEIGETVKSSHLDEIKSSLETCIKTDKRDPHSELSFGSFLKQTKFSIVWKGSHNKTPVAIKIFGDDELMKHELSIFEALGAINDDVLRYGIPRVYYHGKIFEKFHGIAMTLFGMTLQDYHKNHNPIANWNILSIFRKMVFALEYLNKCGIVHNNIEPANIFYEGDKLFIADFGAATLNGIQATQKNDMVNKKFASSNYYREEARGPKDDLESLVFTMWFISGIKLGETRFFRSVKYEGEILKTFTTQQYKLRVYRKLAKLNDANVIKEFQFICVDQMLSENSSIDYETIIRNLDFAMAKIDD